MQSVQRSSMVNGPGEARRFLGGLPLPVASLRVTSLLVISLLLWPAAAQDRAASATAASPLPSLQIDFEQHRLDNGLRIITVEDHRVPMVSMVLVFDVGAADERPGRTGFAHLFEHLMFQGSENVDPGEHISLIEKAGGFTNATTGTDYTAYFDSVPANRLDLALFLNADRLRSLDISARNLAKEKEVVKEERRLRFDNQPYRPSRFVLNDLLYDSFAYGHDGVGSMEDIDAAALEDIRAFFDSYYTVNNAVLVLVGDFETRTAVDQVEHWLGGLPARPRPPSADRSEPRQTQDRRHTVDDPLAPLPRLNMAFKAVSGEHPDFYALQVLSAVLLNGRSSRLHRELVKQRKLATSVSGYADERRGAGALYITAMLPGGVVVEEVEQAIHEQIKGLQNEPVEDWEIEKAKSLLAADHLDDYHRSLIRAFALGVYAVDFDDPGRVNTYLDRIAAVDKQDLQRVARTHLREGNRTVVLTVPKSTPAPEEAKP